MTTKPITSEAVERVRAQLREDIAISRADVAEVIDDYDALAETYWRIVRGLSETQ